jgi:Peptide methionine sulfoxide reductase
VGYAGGSAETVQLDFNPSQVTYEALVEKFFAFHDATRAPSSGWSMSAIFVDGPEQERVARSVMQRVQENSKGTIQTRILPDADFHLAGESQQKHALRGDNLLFGEFRAMYPDVWDLVDSTAAMRVNAYVYGSGSDEQLQAELGSLGLSAAARDELLAAAPAAACPVE